LLSTHRHLNITAATLAPTKDRISISAAFSCTPQDVQVVVYNRIAKCGSTTLLSLFSHLAEKNNFTLIRPTPEYNHIAARDAVLTALATGTRTVVSNHFAFPEILYGGGIEAHNINKNKQQMAYINVMRNPVDRCTSVYYYSRYGNRNGQLKENTLKEYGNLTLDECVSKPYHEIQKCFNCESDKQALAFCGREGGDCNRATADEIIEQAWENVQAHYFVGITEDLHGTAEMLELLYPSFFKGITAALEVTVPKKVTNTRREYIGPSVKARKEMEKWAAVDMELYTRVRARYTEQRKACF